MCLVSLGSTSVVRPLCSAGPQACACPPVPVSVWEGIFMCPRSVWALPRWCVHCAQPDRKHVLVRLSLVPVPVSGLCIPGAPRNRPLC